MNILPSLSQKLRKYFMSPSILAVAALLLVSSQASASDLDKITEIENAINTVWVLLGAILVFFMQAGFGMLEAGFIRAKNTVNILTKNFLDFAMSQLGFFAVGYGLMFGSGNGWFGTEGFFLSGIGNDVGGIPLLAFWFFQACFCGAAATIVAGGMAGRMKFKAYLAYSIVLSAVVYPVVGHWIWGGGWLAELGFLDFAGSTVVHATGGWAAFVGAWIIGARIGKYNQDGTPRQILGHNIPLAALGTFILWFGWFGFNAASSLSGMAYYDIALIAANTNLAASAGAVSAMLLVWFRYGKPDVSMVMNGALAGLVGITAPCAFVSPGSAIIIGALAGIIMVYAVSIVDGMKIDDPVGAVAVHGVNGVWGTLSIGLFHMENGLFFGGGMGQLVIQAIGALACLVYVLVAMFIVFKVIDVTIGLRVSREQELKGLDLSEHGMESYASFQIFSNQ